jgi:nucleotidyltransferase substrate binding protein (TIGR01987 family)
MDRKDKLKQDFKNILDRWKEALEQSETELARDASILRFELAFEVGWKYIQLLAREEGYEVNSPRQAFQQAFSMGWISDEVIWVDILKARNTATHVYREEYAKELIYIYI